MLKVDVTFPGPLTPAQRTGTSEGRNLKIRLDILRNQDPFGPFSEFMQQERAFLVRYPGTLDKNVVINPGDSEVAKLFKTATRYDLDLQFFGFDSDGLVGQVTGSIRIKP